MRIVSFLKRGLTAEGYSVEVASDGAQGWQLARTGEFQLLILDRMLPKLDGSPALDQRSAQPRAHKIDHHHADHDDQHLRRGLGVVERPNAFIQRLADATRADDASVVAERTLVSSR